MENKNYLADSSNSKEQDNNKPNCPLDEIKNN